MNIYYKKVDPINDLSYIVIFSVYYNYEGINCADDKKDGMINDKCPNTTTL